MIQKGELHCWNDTNVNLSEETAVPKNLNAVDFDIHYTVGCSHDGRLIRCFGDKDSELSGQFFQASQKIEKIQVDSVLDSVCVLANHSVECFGQELANESMIFNHYAGRILDFDMEDREACIVTTDHTIFCTAVLQKEMVALSRPTHVKVSSGFACALDEGKLSCWGSNVPPVPNATKVKDFSLGPRHLCLSDDDQGVLCSGESFYFGASRTPTDF